MMEPSTAKIAPMRYAHWNPYFERMMPDSAAAPAPLIPMPTDSIDDSTFSFILTMWRVKIAYRGGTASAAPIPKNAWMTYRCHACVAKRYMNGVSAMMELPATML